MPDRHQNQKGSNGMTAQSLAPLPVSQLFRHHDHPLCQPDLSAVLSYENEGLIERLQQKESLSEEDSHALFSDLKKFLFLCGTKEGRFPFGPPEKIDSAWHHFILFTKDYARFCHEFFGHFIHHNPVTSFNRPTETGIAQHTLERAQELFGSLSKNWVYEKGDSSDCQPSTNCQESECW